MVMEERLLRVVSSNLSNRSHGLDAECDLAVEAGREEADMRRRIARLRDDLPAEHLGLPRTAVQAAVAGAGGPILAAIEALHGAGRTLVPFAPRDLNALEEAVFPEDELLDPERPVRRFRPRRSWWSRRR